MALDELQIQCLDIVSNDYETFEIIQNELSKIHPKVTKDQITKFLRNLIDRKYVDFYRYDEKSMKFIPLLDFKSEEMGKYFFMISSLGRNEIEQT